jgi:excisionase family DNA binding protein
MNDDESNKAPTTDSLHDLRTVARRLNVAVKTVRRMIVCGELEYHQIGRLKRVSDGQYLDYLSRTRRGRNSDNR